jgi:hypothetical protein
MHGAISTTTHGGFHQSPNEGDYCLFIYLKYVYFSFVYNQLSKSRWLTMYSPNLKDQWYHKNKKIELIDPK